MCERTILTSIHVYVYAHMTGKFVFCCLYEHLYTLLHMGACLLGLNASVVASLVFNYQGTIP